MVGVVTPLSAQVSLSSPHKDFCGRLKWSPDGVISNPVLRLYGFGRLDLQRQTLFNDGTTDSSLISGRGSKIGIKVRRNKRCDDWNVNSRMEFDFRNGTQAKPRPRLRCAYVEAKNKNRWALLAGQYYDAWYISSPTLLASVYPVNRRPQVRLTKITEFENRTRLTARVAAVKNQSNNIDEAHANENSEIKRSLLQSAVILERPWLTKRAARIALTGSYGRESCNFRDLPEADGTYDTCLIMINGRLPLCERFTAGSALYSGENIDTYFLGGAAKGINCSHGRKIKGAGGWAQGTYYYSPDCRFNAGYSFLNLQTRWLEPGDRSLYECYSANTVYFLRPDLQLVLGGNYFIEEQMHSASRKHARIQCSIYYFF
ncbi:MAG: hypothetical protein R6V06_01470 [Kiritimatiellia bacterium]